MPAIQKILVPVDFSEHSKKALGYGLSLALELDAKLLLAHVVPATPAQEYLWPAERQVSQQELDDVENRLHGLIDYEYRSWLEPGFAVVVGNIGDELLAIATDEVPDLIVMGTHGRRRFERWLRGSVTEHILRWVTVPILTVSQLEGAHDIEKPRPIPLDKLLYATDLSPGTDRGMETALMLAQEFSAELIVLHVVRWLGGEYPFELLPPGLDQHAARSRHAVLERLVASVPESARREPWVRIELLGGAPSERILRFADDQNVDMIVLNIRSPSGLDRALLGSTAKRVVRGAHVPVLSVPPGSGARTQLTRLSPTHLQDMGPRARNETHTSRS